MMTKATWLQDHAQQLHSQVKYITSKNCTVPLALLGRQAPAAVLKLWIAWSASSQTKVIAASYTEC